MAENYEFYSMNSNIRKRARASVARIMKSLQTHSSDDTPYYPKVSTSENEAHNGKESDNLEEKSSSAPRNLYSPCSGAIGDQDRTCCNSCLSMLSELLKSQEIMKQQLVLILKNQQMQNSSPLQRDEILDVSEFNLPLTDSSGLERLETQLKEQPEQMKKLVAYFGIIGGFSTKEAVWRILGKLLVNSLAKQINWSGANQKVAFRALTLRTVIVNAVRTNVHTKSATDKEVEKYITRWLQLAPDRDGGRKERVKGNSS